MKPVGKQDEDGITEFVGSSYHSSTECSLLREILPRRRNLHRLVYVWCVQRALLVRIRILPAGNHPRDSETSLKVFDSQSAGDNEDETARHAFCQKPLKILVGNISRICQPADELGEPLGRSVSRC